MVKHELIKQLAERANLPNVQSELIVNQFFDSIFSALIRGESVEIRGLGTFYVKEYRSKIGRNPRTGQSVELPPRRLPHFRPSKELKDRINGKKTSLSTAPTGLQSLKHNM